MRLLPVLLLLACATDGADTATRADHAPALDLPEHNECLAEGEQYSDAVCRALVEEDGRYPGVSEDKADGTATAEDPRLDDPEFQWFTGQLRRCACRCCHSTSLQGPGAYFWDLEWEPVWIDSASTWSLSVMGGWTNDETQTIQTEDLDRARAYIEQELDRRDAL